MYKRIASWFLIIAILAGVIYGVWLYFQDQYTPKAYLAVMEIEHHDLHYTSDIWSIRNSFILAIDLYSHEVDTFPIQVKIPRSMRLDPTGRELYLSGLEGYELDPETEWTFDNPPGWHQLHVYNVPTGELARIIESPGDADGVFRGMRVTPDGKRLYTNNPYENVEDAPTEEKQKRRWALDPQTGEFLFGFDNARPVRYLTKDGSKSFSFVGAPNLILEPGFRAFDIENDKLITAYMDFDRLMEEQGGLHVNKEGAEVYIESFEFEYPYMYGRKPLRFYDRDTFEVIGEVDLRANFDEKKIDGISHPFNITDDNKYAVFRIKIETDAPEKYKYYIRLVDIAKMEIVDTFKVWEGYGRVIGPRVH